MATSGQRPKAAALRLIDGTAAAPTLPKDSPIAEGRPVLPKWLKGTAVAIWHEANRRWFWLAEADSYKLAMFASAEAEFQRVGFKEWQTNRLAEHRKLQSDLGGDPGSRARISGGSTPGKTDPGESFFDR